MLRANFMRSKDVQKQLARMSLKEGGEEYSDRIVGPPLTDTSPR